MIDLPLPRLTVPWTQSTPLCALAADGRVRSSRRPVRAAVDRPFDGRLRSKWSQVTGVPSPVKTGSEGGHAEILLARIRRRAVEEGFDSRRLPALAARRRGARVRRAKMPRRG